MSRAQYPPPCEFKGREADGAKKHPPIYSPARFCTFSIWFNAISSAVKCSFRCLTYIPEIRVVARDGTVIRAVARDGTVIRVVARDGTVIRVVARDGTEIRVVARDGTEKPPDVRICMANRLCRISNSLSEWILDIRQTKKGKKTKCMYKGRDNIIQSIKHPV